MSELTRHEWQELLSGYTTSVLVGNWVVGAAASAGATSFTVVLADTRTASTNGTPPLVGASDAANFVGARIVFGRGVETPLNLTDPQPPSTGLNFGVSTTVQSVVTDLSVSPPVTTLTLNDPVPQALAVGDTFTIFRVQPANDPLGPDVVPDVTVPAGTVVFVASGDEQAYQTLAVAGTDRINGAVYTQNVVLLDGGQIILADQALLEQGAFA